MPDEKPPVARYLDEHPNFGYWAGTVIGAVLTLVGCAVIFQLLTAPTPRDPESQESAICLPASQWRSVSEDVQNGLDQAQTLSREYCTRVREERTSTAILVAVPTSMAGSLTGAAIIFRRRLTSHQQSSDQNDQASE